MPAQRRARRRCGRCPATPGHDEPAPDALEPLLSLLYRRSLLDVDPKTERYSLHDDATAYIGDLRYDKRCKRIPQLEAALAAARRLDRKGDDGAALGNLGLAYAALGELARSIELMQVFVDYERGLRHPDAEKHAPTSSSYGSGWRKDKQASSAAGWRVCSAGSNHQAPAAGTYPASHPPRERRRKER